MSTDLFLNPAFPRAIVLGLFGGIGLALTAIYSRRGPLIFPVYAAVLAALAVLLSRYMALPFTVRLIAALAGFCAASFVAYIAIGILAQRNRRDLVAQGRLPKTALRGRTSVLGHAWRWGFLLVVGTVASAGIAFISG
jgi:hypothetical protein